MLLLALWSPALAGSVFASVDEEVQLGGGTWGRLHPYADGWMFFMAVGGEVWAEDLALDLSGYDDRGRIQISEHGSLQDVQSERCPDGTWMVAGSYTLDSFDDSAAIWHVDADMQLIDTFVLEERNTQRAHNDMAVLCTTSATGVAYSLKGNGGSSFLDVDLAAGEVPAIHPMSWAAMGGSLARRPSDGRIVGADIRGPQDDAIRLTVFDTDWSALESVDVPAPADTAFWPQRLLPLDDGWVLAVLTRPANEPAGDGEVWLMALDAEFNVQDTVRVSPEGTRSARPWVARQGGVLAVSYDRDVKPRIVLVHLDDDAVPDDDDLPDTGLPDDGDSADTGDGAPADCACGSGAAALAALPGLALWRRRRGAR